MVEREYREGRVMGEERKETMGTSHKILMDNRKKGSLTGIKDVIAFEPKEVLLQTTLGYLSIKGQDLKVTRLSVEKGEVDFVGKVDSMEYAEDNSYGKRTESFITRMFR